MTDKADRATVASAYGRIVYGGPRYLSGDDLLHDDEDDFDALLEASSFGSAQACALREQTPATARAHAQRVVDGEERCAPPEGDIDDAVGGLVQGIIHGVVPDWSPPNMDLGLTFDQVGLDLWQRPHVDPGQSSRWTMPRMVIIMECKSSPSSALWPDQRVSLLQALVDHDAFGELRPDVAWMIVDCILEVPRPPRVLSECFVRVVEQVDVAALASSWLPPYTDTRMYGSVLSHLLLAYGSWEMVARMWVANAGLPGTPMLALDPPPQRTELTGTARPALPRSNPDDLETPPDSATRPQSPGAGSSSHPPLASTTVLVLLAGLTALMAMARDTGIRAVIGLVLGVFPIGVLLTNRARAFWRRE